MASEGDPPLSELSPSYLPIIVKPFRHRSFPAFNPNGFFVGFRNTLRRQPRFGEIPFLKRNERPTVLRAA